MTESSAPLRKKLQIPDDSTGEIIDCPDEVELGIAATRGGADFRIVFVRNAAEVSSTIASAMDGLRKDGLLWYYYPKKTSGLETDISRDVGWAPLHANGFKGVPQIAIDDVWSAVRFRETRFVSSR
jgi:hypothetical protein